MTIRITYFHRFLHCRNGFKVLVREKGKTYEVDETEARLAIKHGMAAPVCADPVGRNGAPLYNKEEA